MEWRKKNTDLPEKQKGGKIRFWLCAISPMWNTTILQIGVPYPENIRRFSTATPLRLAGTEFVNPRVKMSKKVECDERKNSITVKIPPLGISVFSYTRPAEKAKDNKTAKTRQKKTSATAKKNLKKELEQKFETEEK